IRDDLVTGVQTCALPISAPRASQIGFGDIAPFSGALDLGALLGQLFGPRTGLEPPQIGFRFADFGRLAGSLTGEIGNLEADNERDRKSVVEGERVDVGAG